MEKSISLKNRHIIAVVGPTASGKSDLAVVIARYIKKHRRQLGVNGAEIISADSRQVYRGLDLSSGKVTKKEMGDIPHHMLDIASPRNTFSVATYQSMARSLIEDMLKKNVVPIVCGGTGLYVDALLFDTTFPSVPPRPQLRKKLEEYTTEKLFSFLKRKDPRRSASIDQHNRRRLIRALEIVITTRKPVPTLIQQPRYTSLWIGIASPKETLDQKIYRRILQRLRLGMVAEIRRAHEKGVSWRRLEDLGLEFRWLSRYLRKKIGREEMIQGLFSDIRQYAKRQMTWLKKNSSIHWITDTKKALTLVEDFLKD